MKVLALIESADHVCYRYRFNALAWSLAQEGLLLDALPIQRGVGRIPTLLAGSRADIVILQRKLLPAWQLAILRRHATCLVYDIDDALFRRDTYTWKNQQSHSRLSRFRGIVRAADAVLAGNEYLTQFASIYVDPSRVHFVPTCVEPSWYPLASHRRSGSWARLGWIGQRCMLPSLDAMGEHLIAIGKRLPDVSLRVISDALPQISGVRMELRPWSSATEAAELAATDIGVSWLCDDLWGQGKCGLKVLQYMAAGLPVVANSVGVHRKMIVHGQSGFLVDTPDEWAEAVALLAENPSLRHRMGTTARRIVENDYNVSRWGPKVARLLRQLVDKGPTNHKILENRECNNIPQPAGTNAGS
ncbi:MAG: glycosyltransferase family 4 protein [Thermoguttaceae bacterium]